MTIGLTKDAGRQLGVRRTVPVPPPLAWDFLLGEGLPLWLGETTLGGNGTGYRTADGVTGQVRGRTDGLRIRLTWQPPDRDAESTLQVTVRAAASGTTIGFHQERLADAEQRAELLAHWRGVLDRIVATLSAR